MRRFPEISMSTWMFPHPLAAPLLLFRELSLQAADEDECGGGGQPPHKKKKKKKMEDEEGAAAGVRLDTEHWVMKRQQRRERKAEEVVKNKRTVFVGNLPASCTKKVCQGHLSICPSIHPFIHRPASNRELSGV